MQLREGLGHLKLWCEHSVGIGCYCNAKFFDWGVLGIFYETPTVTCILTETNKVRHVVDNMRAGYGRLPDEATCERMSEYLLSLA